MSVREESESFFWDERSALDRILPKLHLQGDGVEVAAGDDCAAMQTDDFQRLLLHKIDSVVEGVHFEKITDPAELRLVGRKAVARVLSDIAAMGGVPSQVIVALIIPSERTLPEIEQLYTGINSICQEHQLSVVGGDISSAAQGSGLSVSISGIGFVGRDEMLLRNGAKVGDSIFVTGRLGGSFLSGRHLSFIPRLAEAQYLASSGMVSAMMDLSDGLAADLPKLAAASQCGFQLQEDRLPLHEGCTVEMGLGDGEDYELLLTTSEPEQLLERWAVQFPSVEFTEIGKMCVLGQGDKLSTEAWQHHADNGKV